MRDVRAILDALPTWFGARVDVARAGVMGHSRGTLTALAAAGGSTAWGFGPEPRVRAIMGMAIGARAFRDMLNLSSVKVPTLLVAGGKDRNTVQAISEETIATITSPDKRFVAIPNATHRSFDSTYCAQLQSAGAIAQANPRAILDRYSVPLIARLDPGGISGKAVHYCAESFLTTPVDIRPMIASTPSTEYPPALNDVCSTTSIPCTGLDTRGRQGADHHARRGVLRGQARKRRRRRGERDRPRHALADPRPARRVRGLHAGRRQGLPRLDHGQRDLHRR